MTHLHRKIKLSKNWFSLNFLLASLNSVELQLWWRHFYEVVFSDEMLNFFIYKKLSSFNSFEELMSLRGLSWGKKWLWSENVKLMWPTNIGMLICTHMSTLLTFCFLIIKSCFLSETEESFFKNIVKCDNFNQLLLSCREFLENVHCPSFEASNV